MNEDVITALEAELIKTNNVNLANIINNVERRIHRTLTFDEATMLLKLSASQINTRNTLKLLYMQEEEK